MFMFTKFYVIPYGPAARIPCFQPGSPGLTPVIFLGNTLFKCVTFANSGFSHFSIKR